MPTECEREKRAILETRHFFPVSCALERFKSISGFAVILRGLHCRLGDAHYFSTCSISAGDRGPLFMKPAVGSVEFGVRREKNAATVGGRERAARVGGWSCEAKRLFS